MSWLSSLVGGLTGKTAAHASTEAADTQASSYQSGIDETKRQFDISNGQIQPWLQAGQTALGGEMDLLGQNGGEAQQSSIDALKASPLYQSLFHNGMNAAGAMAAATGGLRGGNAQHSFAQFGTDTLAKVIESQLGHLGGISGAGQAAAGTSGDLGQSSSAQIAALLGQQGTARAGGIIGAANARNSLSDFYKQLTLEAVHAAAQAAGAGGF
jgi:hypothetical protein